MSSTTDHNWLFSHCKPSQTSRLSVPAAFYGISWFSGLQAGLSSCARRLTFILFCPLCSASATPASAIALHITAEESPGHRVQQVSQRSVSLLQLHVCDFVRSCAKPSPLLNINSVGIRTVSVLFPDETPAYSSIPSLEEALKKYLLNEVFKKGKHKSHMHFML